MSFTTAREVLQDETLIREQSTLQRISNFAARLIAVTLTAFTAVVVITLLLTSQMVSSITHIKGFEVTSGSMEPTFSSGSIVLSHVLPDDETQSLNVGDIITYKSANNSEMLITHRIVEVQNPGTANVLYTTKGDANQSVDLTHVTAKQIIGRYETSIPILGHLIEAMHRFQIVGLFSVALIFAYISMATNKQPTKNKKEKQQ